MDVFTCCECGKDFGFAYNLKKHARKFHPDKVNVIVPRKSYKHHCAPCQRNFNNTRDFNYHKKKYHSLSEGSSRPKDLGCPICSLRCSKPDLLTHFETRHDIKVESKTLDFLSLEEMVAWKTEMEKNTKALFVKQRGTFVGNKKSVLEYICHRSGNYTSKSKGFRHLKVQGSNKINGFCPASIKVHFTANSGCKVFFVDKHVGHENELWHLSLTFKERETLAKNMTLKIPSDTILDEVRDSAEGSQLERIHLLTKREENIEKSFNLQSTVIRHANDAISVEAWVQEMDTSGCELDNNNGLLISENPDVDEASSILTSLSCQFPASGNQDMKKVSKGKKEILETLIPHLKRTAERIVCIEQVDAFKKLCAPIAPTMAAIEKKLEDLNKKPRHTCATPHNKKISPQRNIKLHSTKKKKREDSHYDRKTGDNHKCNFKFNRPG